MTFMMIAECITNMFHKCGTLFVDWAVEILPSIFMILILCNALIRFVSKDKIEKIAQKASGNVFLKYMIVPFLAAIFLGNPVSLALGKFVDEKSKPSYYASASYFCHTSNGVFPHINAGEMFIWLGVAKGVEEAGYSTAPLAIAYLLSGLVLNFLSGIVTDITTNYFCHRQGIHLGHHVHLESNRSVSKKQRVNEIKAEQREELLEPADVKLKVCAGRGGYGGPLFLRLTKQRNKIAYITGGGIKPKAVERIEALTGCESVNGFSHALVEEELFAVVIDCAGTLRCGLYPKKRIPTINIMPTGKSGPLAKYITEDIYVSAVGENEIEVYDGEDIEEKTVETAQEDFTESVQTKPAQNHFDILGSLGMKIGFVIQTFYKASQDAVQTIFKTIVPLMGFVSLFMGIIEYSGFGTFLSNRLKFLGAGSAWGLIILGFVGSIPLLSPLLSPGAIIAQVVGAFIGVQIGSGAMPVYLALPALYAINTQAACDFIPVGLGLADAKEDTINIGVTSVLTSRFLTSIPRVCGALAVGMLMNMFIF